MTKHSAVSLLSAYNVTVGLGVEEQWSSRNLRFDLAWVRLAFFLKFVPLHLLKEKYFVRLLLKQTGRYRGVKRMRLHLLISNVYWVSKRPIQTWLQSNMVIY